MGDMRDHAFRSLCPVTRNGFEAEELAQGAFLAVADVRQIVVGTTDEVWRPS